MKAYVRKLPSRVAAIYFAGRVNRAVVSSRLNPRHRRVAVEMLGRRPWKAFDAVMTEELEKSLKRGYWKSVA